MARRLSRRAFLKTTGLVGLGLGLGLKPTQGTAMTSPPFERVIVLGFDGLDPRLTSSWMAEGRLPHMARLAGAGAFSPLATVDPPQSPVAWSGLGTGTNPGRHGVYDFIVRNPKNYLPDLSLIRLGRSKLGLGRDWVPPVGSVFFWDHLAAMGRPAVVVRWPLTFPADASKARLISGLGTPDVRGQMGRYTFYTEKPPAGNDLRGDVIPVRFDGPRARTVVRGPLAALLGRPKPVEIEIELERLEGRLRLRLPGGEVVLETGGWSDWRAFSFRLPLRQDVRGVARFHLAGLDPLRLYLTPVQADPESPCFPISRPESYAAELAGALGGRYATLGMPEDTKALTEEVISDAAFLEMCGQVMAEREKMLEFELGRFKEGLLACVFDTADRVQHMFWRLLEPNHPGYDRELLGRLGPVIQDHYRWADRIIGRVLEALDERTALLVCSDHGFTSYTRSVNLNTWLAENGYLALKSHDREDPGELFQHVDWSGTRAYALGFGSIYLNLAGRERNGQVRPGEEATGLAREIEARLLALTDPLTGANPVARVHHKADIYEGPLTTEAPEIVVGYRPPYRVSWTTAIGGQGAEVFEDNRQKWSGDHCVDASLVPGILLANLRFEARDVPPRQTQLAAAVCRLLGVDPDPAMEPGLL
ncbi:MAG: alkaline phosphatase family protein [Thermodesulfobacteriota bacterium]